MNFRFLFFVFLLFAGIFGTLEVVKAQGIVGVSPGSFSYDNVLRGGYAERLFTITFSGNNDIEVSVEPLGDIRDWIKFSSNKSIVRKDDPWFLSVSIEPPADVPNGNYTGFFRVRTSAVGSAGAPGTASGNVIAVLDAFLQVEITDFEIVQCDARGFEARTIEEGDDLAFEVTIENQGNIRLKPRVLVDMWDQEQIDIVKNIEFTGKEVLPTREEKFIFRSSSDDLEIGQYWIDMLAVQCGEKETLTMDILEIGSLRANGVIKEIIAPVWTTVDETIPMFVIFENNGEKEVDARFIGQINLGDRIVQTLESEVSSFEVGETSNFTFFFTPRQEGRYVVSGRVLYDKKRTFEAGKVINVKGKEIGIKQIGLYALYGLVILVILYLYYRIRKERKRMMGR